MLPANYEYQNYFARKFYDQGSRERLITLIAKLLGMRFGELDEVALSRIAAASNAELEKVAEHLLTAPTLDAALGAAAVLQKRLDQTPMSKEIRGAAEDGRS